MRIQDYLLQYQLYVLVKKEVLSLILKVKMVSSPESKMESELREEVP